MLQVGKEKAYTVQEVAMLLDVSAVTVRSYIRKGKLKAQRVGKGYFILEKNIEAYLNGDVMKDDH